MGNDVRIQVHWDDPDGDKFQAAQKTKAKKAGQAAGDEFIAATRAKAKKAGDAAADDFEGSFSGKLTKASISAAQKAGTEAAKSYSGSFSGSLGDELAKAGEDAAKKANEGFEKETKKNPAKLPIKAANPIDAAWRKQLDASVKRTASGAIKIPATPDTEDFRRNLEATLKRAATMLRAEIPVDPEDAATFRHELEVLVAGAEAGIRVHVPVDVDEATAGKSGHAAGQAAGRGVEDGLRDGARRGGKATDDEMSRVAGRANKAFDAKLFTGLSVGLPAAAAIGAIGASAVLALPGAAAIGVAAMILRSNEQVEGSFNDLSNNVIADSQQMAQVMAGPLAGAGSDLQASWSRLRPLAQEAFRAAVPEVKTLTGAVTDLAEGALPGMVTGLKASHPALLGVRVLAGEAGQGLGELFANASQGSAGAGQGMTLFAGTLRMVEGRAGTLFANLANGSSGPLMQLHVVLDQATGALLNLTSQGSAAISFLSGFGSAAGGTITVLHGLVALMSALPQGISQFGGTLAATSMIASKFGLDIGKNFEGIGAKVRAAGNDLGGIEKGAAKAGTAVGSLAAAAISPTTLAVAGLATGLMLLGQHQQEAAADTAAHASRERDLAAALRESKGAVTENVRATAVKKLADYQVSDGTRNLIADTQKLAGESGVKLLTDGYLGNVDASKKLVTQLRETADAHKHLGDAGDLLFTNFKKLDVGAGGVITAMDDTGFAASQLADIVEASGGDFSKAKEQLAALGFATAAGAKPMNAMESAMEGLKSAASGSEERLSALVDVLNILEGRNASFEESIQSGNDALRGMEENLKKGIEKADGFGKSLLNADGSLNTFTANGSQLQDLATGLQTSFAQAGGSIDDMVRKGMPFDQAVAKVNESLATQRDRFVDIAQKMGLTKGEAQALADKYGLLPKEITSRITADTKQAEDAIRALPDAAANTHGAVPISADVNQATNQINTVVQYADGSTGVITVDGNKDPATGQVMVAVQYANGQHTYMTIDAFNQAAKDRTLEAKRNADGTVAYILVDANTGPASDAIRGFTNKKYVATVYVETRQSGPNPVTMTGPRRAVAKGGMVGYASGGEVYSVPRRAGGGLSMLDVTRGGAMSGVGTGTSDSIMALSSAGPFRGSNGEFVIRASQTRKWRPLLENINAGVNGFAGGGLVGAAQEALGHVSGGGQFFEDFSFYGGSANMDAYNDRLASMYYAQTHNDFDPKTENTRSQIVSWLQSFVAQQQGTSSSGGGGRGARGPAGGVAPATVHIDLSGGDRMFMEWLKSRIRVDGGGNVQAALGQR